jgi:hypothetical protein
MRTYIWGSGRTRGGHIEPYSWPRPSLELALCRSSAFGLLDPFSFPSCTIVLSVHGLGVVPFVHDGAGPLGQLGALITFRPEGIWWIDGLWPGIC